MDTRRSQIFEKHFDDVKYERKFGGYYHIRCSQGEFDYSPRDGFNNPVGGSDLYRRMLLCGEEIAPGGWTATGSTEHIMAAMAHGDDLGIAITPLGPTVYPEAEMIAAGFFFIVGLVIGWHLSDFFVGVCTGLGVTLLGMFAIGPALRRMCHRWALEGGQKYRNPFPSVHGDDRRSQYDDARKRGLL
jgi:hypothetical protein